MFIIQTLLIYQNYLYSKGFSNRIYRIGSINIYSVDIPTNLQDTYCAMPAKYSLKN